MFHGMSQHLKDSLWYLYTQSSVTYANLLQAAYAAKVEAEKGRAAHSKAVNLATSPDKVDLHLRDPSPMADSVVAKESKLDKCLKAVTKVAQVPIGKVDPSKSKTLKRELSSAPATPVKSRGPMASSAGPFMGKNWKPIHCWQCGGCGHTTRECPTQGNLNWRELSQMANPPKIKPETHRYSVRDKGGKGEGGGLYRKGLK